MKCKLTLVNVDGQFFFFKFQTKKKMFPETNLNVNTNRIREKRGYMQNTG